MSIRFSLLWLGVFCTGLANAGYLPSIGPAPLRFRAPASVTTAFVLPPLPVDPLAPAIKEPEPAVAGELTVTAGSAVRLTVVDAPAGTNEMVVTPHMLLELYRQQRDTKILTPLTFVPPVPAPSGSSQATYESR